MKQIKERNSFLQNHCIGAIMPLLMRFPVESSDENKRMMHLVQDTITGRYYFPLDPSTWFTSREYEVFNCLLKGYFSSKVIGAQLNISYRTVEHHIEHIRQKMQCTSKYLIVEKAMQLGLLS